MARGRDRAQYWDCRWQGVGGTDWNGSASQNVLHIPSNDFRNRPPSQLFHASNLIQPGFGIITLSNQYLRSPLVIHGNYRLIKCKCSCIIENPRILSQIIPQFEQQPFVTWKKSGLQLQILQVKERSLLLESGRIVLFTQRNVAFRLLCDRFSRG